ncbi:MAG: C-GCAxxG-C-C family protein [Bacillota bacterium]
MSKVLEAVEYFNSGFNCSQAIVSAYCQEFGLDKDTALKISSGFGGGMARHGEVCGAVTGTCMLIGLKHGGVKLNDSLSKEKTYQLVSEFTDRFKERNGSIICRELIECEIMTEEGRKAAEEKFKTVCPKMVKDAAEIIEDLMGLEE